MRAVILDSAMGSRLEEMGHKLTAPLWSATVLQSNPEDISKIHKENIEAGAQVITTNTFRTTPYALHQAGLSGVDAHTRARALTLLAIRLAWKTVQESGKDVKIAASIAPLADCWSPKEFPGNIISRPWHDAQLDNLAHHSTDMLLLETMNSAREAKGLTDLALRYEKPVWVSFTLNGEGNIYNGDDLVATARYLEKKGVSAIGVNCSNLEVSKMALGELRQAISVPLLAYPNLQLEQAEGKKKKKNNKVSPAAFAIWAAEVKELGVEFIGACCGSNYTHIKALADQNNS
ncbi:MAG: homocysteine S-methyltransferase family protein [Candidatus Marinimicrobia bacterium]|nr:homocysteine S-methyltransferase family protein [Candidatus Neomarinimicrobiota bacterium]MCF7921586.1 homocysteine S-methyltransferase family protein [Candidatus Neomarinimicrobiota bacterium]